MRGHSVASRVVRQIPGQDCIERFENNNIHDGFLSAFVDEIDRAPHHHRGRRKGDRVQQDQHRQTDDADAAGGGEQQTAEGGGQQGTGQGEQMGSLRVGWSG